LKHRESEKTAFQRLNARAGERGVGIRPGIWVCRGRGRQFGSEGFGDGVDAVEGAGEDEVVVCGEGGGTWEAKGACLRCGVGGGGEGGG
jgi:hypothetical protein